MWTLRPPEVVTSWVLSQVVVQEAQHSGLSLPSTISIPLPAPVCTTALADGFIKVLFTTLTLGNKLTTEIITRFKTRMTDPDWKVLRETGCLGTSGTLRICYLEKHPHHFINHFSRISSRDIIVPCVSQEADPV